MNDEDRRILARAQGVLLLDSGAKDGQYALVIRADGTLQRGSLGEVSVRGHKVRTYAGIIEPVFACHASTPPMPPLLRYGQDAVLPADLVQ